MSELREMYPGFKVKLIVLILGVLGGLNGHRMDTGIPSHLFDLENAKSSVASISPNVSPSAAYRQGFTYCRFTSKKFSGLRSGEVG